ncbi:MAG: hypothetical protein NT154_22455, partial [Verrucomicrobia bacterium]|nr:hypothetical protein [Verrucomicrobiota bacterium]
MKRAGGALLTSLLLLASELNGAMVNSVTLHIYCATASSSGDYVVNVHNMRTSHSSNQDVWNDAGDGTTYCSSIAGRSTGWQTLTIFSPGPSDLQTYKANGETTFPLGLAADGKGVALFYGTGAQAPYLVVDYTPPQPTVTVTSPNGGENWAVGSSHNITAAVGGSITGWQIDYSINGGSTWTLVTGMSTTSTTINYPWTVPNTPSTACRVRVTLFYSGGSVADISDANFAIGTPPGTPSGPNPTDGAVVAAVPSKFDWADTSGATSYDLHLRVDSGLWTTPGSNLSTSEWWPLGLTGTAFQWYIVAKNPFGTTTGPTWSFTVASPPTVTVTSPNGGESWPVSSTHNITAAAGGSITGWQIDYSINGGSSWTLVTGMSTTSTTIAYPWPVPNTPATTCRVRVTLFYAGGSVADVSDGNFSIVALPDFAVTSISLSPATPIQEQLFVATVTVTNQGVSGGDASYLNVWVDRPNSVTTGDSTWSQSLRINTLNAGQGKSLTVTNLTAPAAAGAYTFRAFIDGPGKSTESDEGNNQSTASYQVSSVAQSAPLDFLQNFFSGGRTLLSNHYQNGTKYIAGLWLYAMPTMGSGGGVEMWIDIDDYFGITNEGQEADPWVTVWLTLDVRLGFSYSLPGGIDVLQLDDCGDHALGDVNIIDPLGDVYVSLKPGFRIAELTWSGYGSEFSFFDGQKVDIGTSVDLVAGYSFQVEKFDIKKRLLDEFVSRSIQASVTPGLPFVPMGTFGQTLALSDFFNTLALHPEDIRYGLAAGSDDGAAPTSNGIAGFSPLTGTEAYQVHFVDVIVQNSDLLSGGLPGNFRLMAVAVDGADFYPHPLTDQVLNYENFWLGAPDTQKRTWAIYGNNSPWQTGGVQFALFKQDPIFKNWTQVDAKDYHLTMWQTNNVDATIQVSCQRLSDTSYGFPLSVGGDLTAGYGAHVRVDGGSFTGATAPLGMTVSYYDDNGGPVTLANNPTVCEFNHGTA